MTDRIPRASFGPWTKPERPSGYRSTNSLMADLHRLSIKLHEVSIQLVAVAEEMKRLGYQPGMEEAP